jgi:hypothetical protein
MENGEWRMENLEFSSLLGAVKGGMTTPLCDFCILEPFLAIHT